MQYIDLLAERDIELHVSPFYDSERFNDLYRSGSAKRKVFAPIGPTIQRIIDLRRAGKYDLIFVQREAMFYGPGVFEWLYRTFGKCPMVLDLDDATYVRYVSPSYGRVGSFLKFPGKTDRLIESAAAVTCGNRFIAEYVERKGTTAHVVPTIVDTEVFCPKENENELPLMGWIGTHSTFRVLETYFPMLESLANKHSFALKLVGTGQNDIKVKGVTVENSNWSLEREVADFQSLDIGLYPISVTESMPADWIIGKSGFKAVQYMSVGVPFVMSPVGVCSEMGIPGTTHFNASSQEEWFEALDRLLSDRGLMLQIGRSGREYAVSEYSLDRSADKLANIFRGVLNG